MRSQTPLLRKRTDALLYRLLKVEQLFRLTDEEVPAQLVTVFCYIASHNPCHMLAIQEDVGLSCNSVSRNTDWLSTTHRLGKPGMGLITKEVDPINARRKLVSLTPKGQIMADQIKAILYEDLIDADQIFPTI
jgi:DNA-binding MarR family transcriptional regulator